MPGRTFPLADVLSVTTGVLLSRRHMVGVYEILSHMTGQGVFTHQPGAACDQAAPTLLEQHPGVADVRPPDCLDAPDLMAWLIDADRLHGTEVDVQPLVDWRHRDPIEDPCDTIGADRVFVVPASQPDESA
ncbi:hypothetical protein ACGFZR_01350 [Streptomyces sp. NPDC048241]|uniref:DUF7736 domain-containing protein n=1 Tax=Streptomyces sp. NPDC048241 TaxID=3365521 RepID=UPI0037211DA0